MFFMIFSQQSHRFVCCNRCLWKKAIYHVTFALKRSVITNIEQWRNSFVHFYYKKIKKHSWHYRIRKVLKRASGNSLKESYYCTLFSCAADVCTLPEILFSGFLWESIWNFFCWGNSTRVGSSWGSADFQWILLHNFLVRNWH